MNYETVFFPRTAICSACPSRHCAIGYLWTEISFFKALRRLKLNSDRSLVYLPTFSPPYLLLTDYRGQNGISLSRRNPQKVSSRPELRPISPVSLGMLPSKLNPPDKYHLLSLFLHLGPANVIYLISSRITLGSLSGSIGTLNFASFLHFPYLFSWLPWRLSRWVCSQLILLVRDRCLTINYI